MSVNMIISTKDEREIIYQQSITNKLDWVSHLVHIIMTYVYIVHK